MRLLDIITPDELEEAITATGSMSGAFSDCEAFKAEWQPYADMLAQRVVVGDVTRDAFCHWMGLIMAISKTLAKKRERGVVN